MIHATLYVDGMAYAGIDAEANDTRQIPGAFREGGGWHNLNSAGGRDVLRWGGEPERIVGIRNLQSVMARVMGQVQDGLLGAREIRIVLEEGK